MLWSPGLEQDHDPWSPPTRSRDQDQDLSHQASRLETKAFVKTHRDQYQDLIIRHRIAWFR